MKHMKIFICAIIFSRFSCCAETPSDGLEFDATPYMIVIMDKHMYIPLGLVHHKECQCTKNDLENDLTDSDLDIKVKFKNHLWGVNIISHYLDCPCGLSKQEIIYLE